MQLCPCPFARYSAVRIYPLTVLWNRGLEYASSLCYIFSSGSKQSLLTQAVYNA
jgi:hypothetical protein